MPSTFVYVYIVHSNLLTSWENNNLTVVGINRVTLLAG